MSALFRARQALGYLAANRSEPPELPDDALELLNEPMLHQFRILQPCDQRHLLNVYRYLVDRNAEPDTVTAGLIHDVGKACMKCRITMLDRTLNVLLPQVVPGRYAAFAARDDASSFLRGLHRLASHPRRGALAASQSGYSDRVCDLILRHEEGGNHDAQLVLLRQADDRADAIYARAARP